MLLHVLVGIVAVAPVGERPKIAVMDFEAVGGADAAIAGALSESVGIELTQRGLHEVITAKDIQTLLGVERQRQMMGCTDEAESCMVELANALGTQFVLTGSLARLGETYQLNLQTIDTRTTKAVGRATRLAADVDELRAGLPWLVAEAVAIPAPPSPSRVIPYTFIGAGSALLIGGGLFGLQAFSAEDQLLTELKAADERGAQLDPLDVYQARSQGYARDKTIGLTAAVVGAGLLTTGILLNRSVSGSSGGVALVPHSSGVALVGVLP